MATYLASKTTISMKAAGDADYTEIAQITTFDGPSFQVASIETTKLSSDAKEYRPGLSDSGEMSFSLQFDPEDTSQLGLKTITETPGVASFQIAFPTLPKATLFTFDGFTTAFEVKGGESETVVTADCTVKITGKVIVTTAV